MLSAKCLTNVRVTGHRRTGHALRAERPFRTSPTCCAESGPSETSKRMPYGGSGSFTEDIAEFCAPSFVQWENDDATGMTKLRVQVLDYPGVLRVICWVLNGMDVRVESAKLRIDDDNMVDNTFFVKARSGQQLSKKRAQELTDRVEDFVMYCSKVTSDKAKEWSLGPVHISNTSHEKYTEITLLEEGVKPGFLLEVASVLSGVGVAVREADIRFCHECESDAGLDVLSTEQSQTGRVFRFLATDAGKKISDQTANTVLYTLAMILGQGHAPTVVPSSLSYAVNRNQQTATAVSN